MYLAVSVISVVLLIIGSSAYRSLVPEEVFLVYAPETAWS